MKRILLAALTVVTLSSCTFIKIDTRALKALLEEEGVDMTVDNKSIGRVYIPDGNMVTEYRGDLAPFTAIESVIPLDIEYSDGEQFVELHASGNIMPFIATTVQNGTLKLHFKGIRVKKAKDMKAVIRLPKLEKVSIDGAGDLNMKGQVNAENLKISVSGAGDVNIEDLVAEDFSINVSGAGDIDIDKILCKGFDAHVSGSGDIDVESIEVENISVKISGAGDAKFAGHATKGSFSVSGIGAIDIKNLKLDEYTTSLDGMAKIITK